MATSPDLHVQPTPAGSSASVYGLTLWGLWLPGEDPATVPPAALLASADAAAQLPGFAGGTVLPVRCARLSWEAPKPPAP